MRSITLIICVFLLSITCDAQVKKDRSFFRFGIRAVSVRGDNIPLRNDFGIKPVIDLGFGMTYNLSKKIRFQPGIHYSPRGFQAKNNFTDSTYVSNSLELHYLDICPNFSYTFGGYQDFMTRFAVWGGPYLGVGIAGRNVLSGKTLNTLKTKADSTFSDSRVRFGDGLNRIDYGFNIGLGVQLEKFTQIGIAYSMGFNNVADNRNFSIYNQSLGFYVTVLFDDMF
jgi:hypothetical protein